MGGEHTCRSCGRLVGMAHEINCTHWPGVVQEAQTIYNPGGTMAPAQPSWPEEMEARADPEPARAKDGCPDGGTCHHGCERACWRVFNAEPLTAARWGSSWPAEVRAAERAALTGGRAPSTMEVTAYGRTFAWTAEEGSTIDGLPAVVAQALDAAREVDKQFGGEENEWTFGGWHTTHEAAQTLLVLHDCLADIEREMAALTAQADLGDPEEKVLGPFARASETSRRAALEAWPKQGTQRWHILHAFRVPSEYRSQTQTGWTRDELARVLFLSPNTIRPRLRELIVGGWVEVCRPRRAHGDDSPLTRDSDAGHESEVLVLTTAAYRRIALARASA